MITKFVLTERVTRNGKPKNISILETYQLAEVVKKLAEIYGEEDGSNT